MPRDARLALLGVLAAVAAAALALGPLQGITHVPDEHAYALQARLLASGGWLGEAPRDPEYVAQAFVRFEPGLHAIFPPGWPLVLALGALVGATWLVNPLLSGLLPLLAFRLTQAVADERAAWRAAVLAALSPGLVVMAASHMSHTSTLVAGLALACAAVGALGAWWAGLAGAYLVLVRPFEAVVVGLPLMAWLLWKRRAWQVVVLPGLAAAALLAWNASLTGDWATFPSRAYFALNEARPGCDSLGFGPEHGCSPVLGSYGHTVEKAWTIFVANAHSFARLALGWTPLALVAVWGLPALVRRAGLVALPLVALPLAYAFYWTQGAAFGARFYHLAYLALLPAAGIGLARMGRAGWAVLLLGAAYGQVRLSSELEGYWCADARVSEAVAGTTGLAWYRVSGTSEAGWPYVGTETMVCDPGTAWNAALGQVPLDGPLQLRVWPGRADVARGYGRKLYPGEGNRLLDHDLASGELTLGELPPRER